MNMMKWQDMESIFERMATKPLKTATIVIAAVLLIATLIVTFIYAPQHDILNFYRQGMYIRNGILPYSEFVFEFPPLALGFFVIPTLFTSDLTTYYRIFAIGCAALMIVGAYLIMKMTPEGEKRLFLLAATTFVALILLYITNSVQKFDPIVMVLTIVSLYFFSRERWTLAYGFMAAAALTKMYPGLFIILMLAYNLVSSHGGAKAVVRGIAACLVVFLATFIPLWASGVSVGDSFSFMTFHTGRGFQVESTMATAFMILGKLGLTEISIVPANYTHDVVGPLVDAILPVWMYISFLIIALSLAYCIWCMPKSGRTWTPQQMAMALMIVCAAFVLTNKVFSTQYMMWFFPFIAMFWYAISGERAKTLTILAVIMQVFCIIFLNVSNDSWEFILFVLARDIILVYLVLEAARILYLGKNVTTAENCHRAPYGLDLHPNAYYIPTPKTGGYRL